MLPVVRHRRLEDGTSLRVTYTVGGGGGGYAGHRFPGSYTLVASGGGLPGEVTMEVDMVDGQPRCHAVALRAEQPAQVAAADLRRVPIGRLLAESLPLVAQRVTPVNEGWHVTAAAKAPTRPRRGRPTTSDERFQEVVDAWAHSVTSGGTNVAARAAAILGISTSQFHRLRRMAAERSIAEPEGE